MEILPIAIIIGVAFAYFVERNIRSNGGVSMTLCMRLFVILIFILIVAIFIAQILTFAHGSYFNVTSQLFSGAVYLVFDQLIRVFCVPAVGGIAVGMLIFFFYRDDRYKQSSAFSVAIIAIALAMTFIVGGEREFHWMERLSKFSIASAELSFSTIQISKESPSGVDVSAEPGSTSGSGAVDVALYYIDRMTRDIVTDEEMLTRGTASNAPRTDLTADFEFFLNVVQPVARTAIYVHDRRASNDLSEYFSLEDIDVIRDVSDGVQRLSAENGTREFPIKFASASPSQKSEDIRKVQKIVNKVWNKLCEEESWFSAVGDDLPIDNCLHCDFQNQENYFDREAMYVGNIPDELFETQKIKNIPLDRSRPYGQILVSWLLFAVGQRDEALHNLVNWLGRNQKNIESEDQRNRVYKFRVLMAIDQILVNEATSSSVEITAYPYFLETARYGQKLLEDLVNFDFQCNDLREKNIHCNEMKDWEKNFYLDFIKQVNNFIDTISKYPNLIVQEKL